MYLELMDYLACPMDHQTPLKLYSQRVNDHGDILEGIITCPVCERVFPIHESIPIFVSNSDIEGDDGEISRWKAEEQKVRDAEATDYDSRRSDSVVLAELTGLTSILNLKRNHILLDIGCGTGQITMPLAKMTQMTVGIDRSFASLKMFEKRLQPDWRKRVHLVQADIFRLPLRNQLFHRVVSHSVFQHLPNLLVSKVPVLETARVLLDQGVFVLSVYSYPTLRAFLTRLLPILLTDGAGYEQEGFHAGKVYFRRYRWQEIKELLEVAFEVERIGGLRMIPKAVLKHGGRMAFFLERGLQRLTVSRSLGYYVLASGRKKAKSGRDRTR